MLGKGFGEFVDILGSEIPVPQRVSWFSCIFAEAILIPALNPQGLYVYKASRQKSTDMSQLTVWAFTYYGMTKLSSVICFLSHEAGSVMDLDLGK